jgi:hypothetical protein
VNWVWSTIYGGLPRSIGPVASVRRRDGSKVANVDHTTRDFSTMTIDLPLKGEK